MQAKETELQQMSGKMSGCEASLTSYQAHEKDLQVSSLTGIASSVMDVRGPDHMRHSLYSGHRSM